MNGFPKFFKDNFLAVAILIAAALIAGTMVYINYGKPRASLPGTQPGGTAKAPSDLAGLPYLGSPNAPVTIVEFGDFQCPYCGRFSHDTEPQIIATYVKTGKAKFVWHDLAFLGNESIWASEAAWCANDQGKFWEYHDLLYNRQHGENEGAFTKDKLKGFARELGLNGTMFNQCLDSDKYSSKLTDERQEADLLGVVSTPTLFVNDKMLVGAQPFDAFKTAIDAVLNGK